MEKLIKIKMKGHVFTTLYNKHTVREMEKHLMNIKNKYDAYRKDTAAHMTSISLLTPHIAPRGYNDYKYQMNKYTDKLDTCIEQSKEHYNEVLDMINDFLYDDDKGTHLSFMSLLVNSLDYEILNDGLIEEINELKDVIKSLSKRITKLEDVEDDEHIYNDDKYIIISVGNALFKVNNDYQDKMSDIVDIFRDFKNKDLNKCIELKNKDHYNSNKNSRLNHYELYYMYRQKLVKDLTPLLEDILVEHNKTNIESFIDEVLRHEGELKYETV